MHPSIDSESYNTTVSIAFGTNYLMLEWFGPQNLAHPTSVSGGFGHLKGVPLSSMHNNRNLYICVLYSMVVLHSWDPPKVTHARQNATSKPSWKYLM